MEIIVVSLEYLLEALGILWILKCMKVDIKKKYYIFYGFIIIVGISMLINQYFELLRLCAMAERLGIFVGFLQIDKKFREKVEYIGLVVIMKECSLFAIETLAAEHMDSLLGKGYIETIFLTVLRFAIALALGEIIKLYLKKISTERILKAGKWLDFLIFLGAFDICICIYFIFRLISISYFKGFLIKGITSFAFLALTILELNIIYNKWLSNKVSEYAKAEHELHEAQKNYYISLLEKEATTKKYRHDMNNHVICIKALLDDGNYAELKKYIEEIYNQTSYLVKKGFHTGNSIIDALTNYYYDKNGKSIEISVKGTIIKEIDIDEIALSSIYSNMLVNAVEAQNFIEEGRRKYICVHLKQGEKYVEIVVKNAMVEESLKNLENIETTKYDKENHGLGIGNIKRNVEGNNGKLFIEAGNYEFCMRVILRTKEKNTANEIINAV